MVNNDNINYELRLHLSLVRQDPRITRTLMSGEAKLTLITTLEVTLEPKTIRT